MSKRILVEFLAGGGRIEVVICLAHLRHVEKESTYEFNVNCETEVDEFHHHVENVPYATILYHPSFLPLFHTSHHVFC